MTVIVTAETKDIAGGYVAFCERVPRQARLVLQGQRMRVRQEQRWCTVEDIRGFGKAQGRRQS